MYFRGLLRIYRAATVIYIEAYCEYYFGAFTRNLNAPRLDPELYTDNPILDDLGINYASAMAGAGAVGLDYVKKKFTMGVQYRLVQPGFRTLGSNYLLSDVEQITRNIFDRLG